MEMHMKAKTWLQQKNRNGRSKNATPLHPVSCARLGRLFALTAVAALALGLLCSCSQAAQEGSSSGASTPEDATNTAMVAYANEGQFLFVDQDTQTPYIPTDLERATITSGGQQIEPSQLEAGNVVLVTGDGIMMESYPGQYPNIFKVEVLEKGSPADAEQYSELVSEIFAPADPAQVPTGSLSYTTDLAQVSVVLNPVSWEWSYPATDTSAAGVSSSDNAQMPWSTDGKLASDVSDARIPQQLNATATFSAKPDSVSVQRMPLIMGDATADSADPGAHYVAGDEQASEGVDFDLVDGTPTFPIEPNYLYVLKVDFASGHVEYAFYTTT